MKPKNNMEYEEYFRAGMGTESVAPFLRSFIQMVRPQRILEIGAGYTSLFLLDGLENNKTIIDEGNLDKKYVEWHKKHYDPKLVIVDDMSLGEFKKDFNIDSKYIEFVQGDFKDKSQELFEKYGEFDFVWFDCGGPEEYDTFMREYWDICSEYVIFHFTYHQGKPNMLLGVLMQHITGHEQLMGGSNVHRMDIIEPHKERQGSITMFKKIKEQRRS
jgi:hypothetical protein